jgi:hypothetical protein
MMPDEDPPPEEPTEDMLMVAPEGADFNTTLRVVEANARIRKEMREVHKDFYDRLRYHEGNLTRGCGILLDGIEPGSPAATYVDKVFKRYPHPWGRLNYSLQTLDDKWMHSGSTVTERDIIDELRKATDERHCQANRTAMFTTLVQRLNELENKTTSERQLFDMYAEGVRNPFLRSFVADWQTDDEKEKKWELLAAKLDKLIENNPDQDTKGVSASAGGKDSIPAHSAVTDRQPMSNGNCNTCGRPGHRAKECSEPTCKDCGLEFTGKKSRGDHWGIKCPKRAERSTGQATSGLKRKQTDDGQSQKKRQKAAALKALAAFFKDA